MRTCVILNPAAGRGGARDAVRDALTELPESELRVSPEPGAVSDLVASAVSDGFRRIAAAGGDGTVSEVATALRGLAAGDLPLECGVLPIGTGNDLALTLGIPQDLTGAIRVMRTGTARPIDAIRCGSEGRGPLRPAARYAWNAIVGGFGGGVADHLTSGRKRRWRRFAYLRAAASELRHLAPHRLRLEVDGRPTELELLMLVIANGSHAGGGIPLAPGAVADDGALDVVGIRRISPASLGTLVPRVLAGRHLLDPRVFHVRCQALRVAADERFRYNRDGESWGTGDAEFALQPGALPFVRP